MQAEDNVLEIALELAASEPAHRPEFFRLLLEATIFILGSSGQLEGQDEGPVTLKTDTQIEVTNWVKPDGSRVIPFFSSLRALQLAVTADEKYIALPARTFFEITRGSALILNPRSPVGKEFTPAEIETLLAEGVNQAATPIVVQAATEVLLGQPANYPNAMVASLTTLLSNHPNVKAAYLAQMFDRTRDEKPHLIIGIEAEGDFENIVREAGVVAAGSAATGEPVDFIRVTRGKSGIEKYFLKEVKPFYEREPKPTKPETWLDHLLRRTFTKRLLLLIILAAASIFVIKTIYALGQSQSNAQANEREFKVKEFKDMPLKVKVKNLQSKTWHKDLEIEVKNISDKPIYFLLAYLIFPDDKVGDGEVGIRLTFGKRENIQILHLADPEDPHIGPGEIYVFTIPEPFRTGFESRHKKYPDLDKNLLLRFAVISFGDGTGFEVGEPRDFRGRKVSIFEGYRETRKRKSLPLYSRIGKK